MTTAMFPIVLDLTARPCLVVGGGSVAERKVRGLIAAAAHVTVVSPAVTAPLHRWSIDSTIRHVAREYRRGDLGGFQLAFVATNAPGVSADVAAEGRERGVWVNAADDPARCDFHLPAIVRRGDLVVAVATGGTSPALARLVREELELYLGPDLALLADVAYAVRHELRRRGRRASGDAWTSAMRGDVRRLVAEGHRDEAETLLCRTLEQAACE